MHVPLKFTQDESGSASFGIRWRGPAQYGQPSTAVTTCVPRTDNGLNWFHFSRADTAQEPPQEIGSSDYAFLRSPYQDQVVVDDIVFGMFGLNLHTPDHFAQRRAHVRYNDRAMPVGLQIYKYFIEERVAQKVMRIQHQTWLSRGIDNDDPLLAGDMQLQQKWIIWRAFKLRQHWSFVFNRKNDDAARIDWLPLIQHRDIVEVEKVQRADSLQFSYVRARRPHVSCDKRAKIPLSKECDFAVGLATGKSTTW